MTVNEFKDMLMGLDGNAEIRIAQQPQWPFEYDVLDVFEFDGRVWIVEGDQLGYLPGKVKNEIGW